MRTWVLAAALQVVALAFIVHRLFQQDNFTTSAGAVTGGCGLMPVPEYVITSRKVVMPDGVAPAAVRIKDGKIADVALLPGTASQENLSAAALLKYGLTHILDFGDLIVSPGLIDTHVHFNEPGREHWEGFVTGSKAAAAGGITTVVLMPLNALPTIITGELLKKKIAASMGKLWVDTGFWGGLVPENAANATVLQGLLDAGALGFKSFMSPSGIADFGSVSRADIAAALPFLKSQGAPFYVHAELPDGTTKFQGDVRSHKNWEQSRPPAWEQNAISLLLELLQDEKSVAEPGFKLHIAHLSDTGSLAAIAEAKRRGVPVVAETCPHYLNFASEDVPEGDTRFKCAPPIRDAKNREAIWEGLISGVVDSLASDHSPAPAEMKMLEDGDFSAAWGGVAALQYNLPATWHGMRQRGLGPELLARWWSQAPAQLAGLQDRKGAIATGMDADFVVWDPEALANTSEAALQHKHKLTPYTDQALAGRVVSTFVRGQQVFAEGTLLSPDPCGSTLLRDSLRARQEQQS